MFTVAGVRSEMRDLEVIRSILGGTDDKAPASKATWSGMMSSAGLCKLHGMQYRHTRYILVGPLACGGPVLAAYRRGAMSIKECEG